MGEKILLTENTALHGSKGTCDSKEGKALWLYQAVNTCFQ